MLVFVYRLSVNDRKDHFFFRFNGFYKVLTVSYMFCCFEIASLIAARKVMTDWNRCGVSIRCLTHIARKIIPNDFIDDIFVAFNFVVKWHRLYRTRQIWTINPIDSRNESKKCAAVVWEKGNYYPIERIEHMVPNKRHKKLSFFVFIPSKDVIIQFYQTKDVQNREINK